MTKSVITLVVRLVTAIVTLAAAVVMLSSSQRVQLQDGFIFIAKYYNFGSFKFFLIVNSVCSIYSLLTILLPAGSMLYRIILVFDVVLGMMVSASVAAAWSYYNLLSKGNVNVPWGPICQITPKFCDNVLGALVAGIIGFSTHTILMAYSFHKIFNPTLGPE